MGLITGKVCHNKRLPRWLSSSYWCAKKVGLVAVLIAALATSAFVISQSHHALVFYPQLGESTTHIERHQQKWLLLADQDKLRPKLIDAFTSVDKIERSFIEDVVAFPLDQELLLIRSSSSAKSTEKKFTNCIYGDRRKGNVISVNNLNGRAAVLCGRPFPSGSKNTNLPFKGSISVEVDGGNQPAVLSRTASERPKIWGHRMVYEVLATHEDVAIFAKGVSRQRTILNLENVRCVFGTSTVIETAVTSAAQEVFRCANDENVWELLNSDSRLKVTLSLNGTRIPSVAFIDSENLNPAINQFLSSRTGATTIDPISDRVNSLSRKVQHEICACTMIWNGAKFLKEWTLYHAHLGVGKFFLYDNNSDDELESVVESLSGFNVVRRPWPWVKTQEAAFAHCAIQAQSDCKWLMYVDIDEYVFPKKLLGQHAKALTQASKLEPNRTSIVSSLVQTLVGQDTTSTNLQVGQISFYCVNFGPSGLTAHPAQGVTQGYTCREKHAERHKSIVYLDALADSLRNVIHHFDLKPEYKTVFVDQAQAVVNHYKFQAWSEFEKKFTKRASTYVVDWKISSSMQSKDRPEGIGLDAAKPINWENSHCEVNDTSLKNYIAEALGSRNGYTQKLA